MERVRRVLEQVVAEGRIPSVSLVVRADGEERFAATLGRARLDPERPAAGDLAYDLASVTKILAGTLVAAALVQEGRVALDAPVDLEGLDPRITARHLLQHTSGLPAWAPLYERVSGPWGTDAARRAVLAAARGPSVTEPGAVEVYSDLGFLALLDLLERRGGAPLDALFHRYVTGPLGLWELRFGGWPQAAATERCPVRGVVVEGTVHDLNCAAMGGISTHAGLFGTARAVAAVGQAILDALTGDPSPLAADALRAFASARGPGSHRLGFDGVSAGYTSTGRHFPPDTVGHLGYTGTSCWIVPSRRAVVVLLTNRVHPVVDPAPIREARPRVHDAVATALGWSP